MVVVAKVDPKLALPQSVVNFVTKQLAGFFLVMVYQQAREVLLASNYYSPLLSVASLHNTDRFQGGFDISQNNIRK